MKLKKRIISIGFAIVMAVNTVIPAFAGQNNGIEQKDFPISLTDTHIDYTDTVGFDFSEVLAMPAAKEDGRGEPLEKLVSDYGNSYINDPYLTNEVINFRRWEWGAMYQSLNQKALATPDYLDTYRLQVEAYLVNKNYLEALSQLDQILRRNPLDVHALSLSIVACKATSYKTQTSARLQALKLISPEAYEDVLSLLSLADSNNANKVSYGSEQLTDMIPDVIAVFGQSPNVDGTPSEGLLSRLVKTKELAEKYPDVKIVLSGGPVKTQYTEASVMKKWLVENGIDEERLILDEMARDTPGNAIGMVEAFKELKAHNILVVGTILHLPRAVTVLKAYGNAVGYDMVIDCAGGGEQPTKKQKETERLYTYVNVLRAGYKYTKEDYLEY